MSLRVILDKFFCLYFIYQMVTTVLLESQAIFPTRLYPQFLRDAFNNYLEKFRDPFLAEADTFIWYKAICVMETLFIPVYIAGVYAYALGARRCPWIRAPCLLYSVWLLTIISEVLAAIMLGDFTKHNIRAPRNNEERLWLASMYVIYIPPALIMMLDTWCGCGYKTQDKPEAKKTD